MSSTAARKGSARTRGRPPLDEPPTLAGATLVPDDTRVIPPGWGAGGRQRATFAAALPWPCDPVLPVAVPCRLHGLRETGRRLTSPCPAAPPSVVGDEPERAPAAAKPRQRHAGEEAERAARGLDAVLEDGRRRDHELNGRDRRRALLGRGEIHARPGVGRARRRVCDTASRRGRWGGYVWNVDPDGDRDVGLGHRPVVPGARDADPDVDVHRAMLIRRPGLILRCILSTVPVPNPCRWCDTTI